MIGKAGGNTEIMSPLWEINHEGDFEFCDRFDQ
jgi:hypothetical protein